MGPILLFDKSLLQSLNIDEAVWLDQYFTSLICPLFYIETLADLSKKVNKGRSPEHEVSAIANKTPEMGGQPCVFHVSLCIEDLLGNPVPLNRQIPITSGKQVNAEGRDGVVFEESKEAKALERWRQHKFHDVERDAALTWRNSLIPISAETAGNSLAQLGLDSHNCRSPAESVIIANDYLDRSEHPDVMLAFLASRFQLSPVFIQHALQYWKACGLPPLPTHAPYAAFCFRIELVFTILLARGLISGERASNRIDFSYCHYLPFCHVFTSSDKLHSRFSSLFLDSDQIFVWGQDLKRDLSRIDAHYALFPEDIKNRGILSFATRPPMDGDYLVSSLWDRLDPNWRNTNTRGNSLDAISQTELIRQINSMVKAPPVQKDGGSNLKADSDMIITTHTVRRRRGKWLQIPNDIKDDDNT